MKQVNRNLLLVALVAIISIISCQNARIDLDGSQATVVRFSKMIAPFQSALQHLQGKGFRVTATPQLRKAFSVDGYFSVLRHISMKPGWTLDFVYQFDNAGGRPVLYARCLEAEPFKSYDEFRAARNVTKDLFTDVPCGSEFYNEYIRLDGSPVSYFEYVVLVLMGDQLFHFWHDNLHDELVICDKSGLDTFFVKWDAEKPFDRNVPSDLRKGAYALDLQPRVSFSGGTVTVSVVVFTKWGGFERQSYEIKQRAPHTIRQTAKETLLDYYCGIVI